MEDQADLGVFDAAPGDARNGRAGAGRGLENWARRGLAEPQTACPLAHLRLTQ
jgi:hypothetical protein